MFDAEWEYYETNRDELVEKYCGKYIVISGNEVVSVYDDENVAYFETIKTIPLGSFMIHHVTEEEEVFNLLHFPVLKIQHFAFKSIGSKDYSSNSCHEPHKLVSSIRT
jgi:hypothetical protein